MLEAWRQSEKACHPPWGSEFVDVLYLLFLFHHSTATLHAWRGQDEVGVWGGGGAHGVSVGAGTVEGVEGVG